MRTRGKGGGTRRVQYDIMLSFYIDQEHGLLSRYLTSVFLSGTHGRQS